MEVRGLSKSYGRRPALVGIDLSIEPGEVLGYLGPNGAGKTTTLRILMGLLCPDRGTARVLGLDCWRDAPALHRRVGYVPGELALYEKMTGHQLLAFVGHLRRELDDRYAAELARRLDIDMERHVRSLSKGNRQKIALLLALVNHPDVLVLDEPTTGLDPLSQQAVHELLREHVGGGGAVLLSSHILAEVQTIADRVAIIREGRLVAVERLADLRAKSLHRVTARFHNAVDAGRFANLPGLLDLAVSGTELTCSAPQSALDALVKQIATEPIVDLSCEEASLEETFLTYYGTETADAA